MSRYSAAQPQPPQPTFEGDQEFHRLDMETPLWLLNPGEYANGQNTRCAGGKLVKRPGTIKPLWANTGGFPGGILGAGLYNNPNGDTKLMLIATPTDVWKVASGGYPTQIGLPDGATLSSPVEFAEHFDKILLHQAAGRPTYQWDGNPAHRFEALAQLHPTAENALVPAAEWSVDYSGRSLFPIDRDRFGVGDFEDYGSWDPATRNQRANAGTADRLTGLFPYSALGRSGLEHDRGLCPEKFSDDRPGCAFPGRPARLVSPVPGGPKPALDLAYTHLGDRQRRPQRGPDRSAAPPD
jgi:hypothetical protein